MRYIAVGGILHETNTFAPHQTSLDAFSRQSYHEGEELLDQLRDTPTAIGGAIAGIEKAGYTPVPLLYATAIPSGTVSQGAYETMLTGLLDALANALPVDGVLLTLHGAMVAEDQDDCEGEILERVRAIVGPHCPVVCTLDMHGNLSPAMVAASDALVAFDTNPHLDTYERGLEAAHILARMLEKGLRPVQELVHPPLLLSALTTWTEKPPLSQLHERAKELEHDPLVVNISVMGGFAYADTPYSGISILVTTTGDRQLAHKLARELAALAWEAREEASYCGVTVEEAVRQALAAERGPVILADVGDNIGGGSPGDGTVLLQTLLEAGAHDSVVVIADPAAVAQAIHAGEGATIEMNVGGKTDTWHGDPVQIRGTVERITDGRFAVDATNHFAQLYGKEVRMGRCAVVNCDGVLILLTERKTPPGSLEQLRSQGINPEQQRIIVVKSAVAFRGAYAPVAAQIIEVDTPGLCSANLSRFSYRNLTRPVVPLDTL